MTNEQPVLPVHTPQDIKVLETVKQMTRWMQSEALEVVNAANPFEVVAETIDVMGLMEAALPSLTSQDAL